MRSGKEVVQVYVADELSSVVTPVRNLVGFEKVELAYVLNLFHPVEYSSRPSQSRRFNHGEVYDRSN